MKKKWFYPLEGQFPKENEEVIIDTNLGEIKVVYKDKTRWENNSIGYTNPKRWRRVEKVKQKAEQKAEEYYYKKYPVTLDIGEEERKKEVTDIFLAGYHECENEHKDDWHYIKTEEDLPKNNSEYLLLLEHGIRVFGYYNGKFWESWNGDLSWRDVKAYYDVPVLDEDKLNDKKE